MLWSIGFMVTFIIGGLTGVLVAVPPADFLLHNSLFLVAHFHNVIIGGVLFGAFAGYTYWFPKAFGFRLHEGLGKAAFWFWLIGFYVAFMPLYAVGFLGMTRRMQHYDVAGMASLADRRRLRRRADPDRHRLPDRAARRQHPHRESLRDRTGDPWDGRSLEWATASPPPAFNFAVLPDVERRGRLLGDQSARQAQGIAIEEPDYGTSRCRAIRRPASSARSSPPSWALR
jgi:cytochrome o ubiquinol oxidase subunit 1